MKRLPLWLMTVSLLGGVWGCERDLPYEAPPEEPINGYRLEGFVTDRLGIPVRGLRIALWYDFDLVDNNPPPSQEFFVDDSTKIVRVQVLDMGKRTRRVLFEGRVRVGYLSFDWDLKDSLGNPVPSGIYTIDFSMNGVSRKSYPVIVNGAVTSVTDSLGHYIISNGYLPVGYSPIPLYGSDGTKFLGNYRITQFVILELYLDIHRSKSVTLIKDQVTRFDFRI